MQEAISKCEEKMQKTIDGLSNSFKTIRAGRANPAVLDRVSVDYYGVPTKIDQMAAVSVPEARLLVIQPWDMSTLGTIEKAILASDLGLNPNNDGKVLRISFPPLNEERRKELTKEIGKHAEEAKVGVRNHRRDTNEKLKALKKDSKITEDDLKVGEEKTQKLTDRYCKLIEDLEKEKVKEIMEI